MLVDGIGVEYTRRDCSIGGGLARVIDFDNPNNYSAAVNQFTVMESQNERRPDVMIFVNGLPLILMELKNPADENATVWKGVRSDPNLQGPDSIALCI
jgi:type I restriction enzyme R subunit